MKITLIRRENRTEKEIISTSEVGAWMERVKTETKAKPVSEMRAWLYNWMSAREAHYEHAERLPQVFPAIEYGRTADGERKMKSYNGIVLLDVNGLADLGEATLVKEQVRRLPQTFAAVTGSSGRSVKIWVRFELPEGDGLPKKEEQIRLFHAHAYRLAVQCYQPILSFPITLKAPSPEDSFRMTWDPEPYYNPSAVAFYLEQPTAMPGEETFSQRRQREENPLQRLGPGFETSQTCSRLFEKALGLALDEVEHWSRDEEDLHPVLVRLAEQCYRAGLPEEETVRQTLIHFYRQAELETVRQTIHNLYRECKGLKKRLPMSPEQETAFRMDEFMNRRYEFRYNQLLGDLEYRQRDSVHFYFRPVDQRVRSSVAMDALQEGIRVWDRDVNRYLSSNRIPLYNPVDEYLYQTGRWDGKDRIRALADLVPCDNPHWRELFYRWFLNMVAHWRGLDKLHANSTSPLLVGEQGYRKSTFCRILLPPELRFGYTDSLDFKSKRDAEMYLGRFLLINIDEFDQISVNQQGFLKHLLQKPVANLRKPYGTSIQEMRRYASFIGTSNHKDLLTDTSGSRRFICIEVTAPIRTEVSINYRQLYAQAVSALSHNERYWFDDGDELLLKESNREFEQVSPLEQCFNCYFRLPKRGETGEYFTPMQMLEYMYSKTKVKSVKNSNISMFGRLLRKSKAASRRTKYGIQYNLVKLE